MDVHLQFKAIRVLKFEFLGYRVGAFINSGVSNFRDARDSGPLLLTPIYLLAGCSAPIWLTGIYLGNSSSNNDNRTPEELAGTYIYITANKSTMQLPKVVVNICARMIEGVDWSIYNS